MTSQASLRHSIKKFVIVLIDKRFNNVVTICEQYFGEVVLNEIGVMGMKLIYNVKLKKVNIKSEWLDETQNILNVCVLRL